MLYSKALLSINKYLSPLATLDCFVGYSRRTVLWGTHVVYMETASEYFPACNAALPFALNCFIGHNVVNQTEGGVCAGIEKCNLKSF